MADSKLHMAQKFTAYNTFINSRFIYHFRNRNIPTMVLNSNRNKRVQGRPLQLGYDQKLRKIYRKILGIRENSSLSLEYYQVPTKLGGLGQTLASNNYLIQSIIQVFRAFNSNDSKFRNFNKTEFLAAAQSRFQDPMNLQDSLEWLNGLRRNTILAGRKRCWYMKCL